jgi:hypothetical protein
VPTQVEITTISGFGIEEDFFPYDSASSISRGLDGHGVPVDGQIEVVGGKFWFFAEEDFRVAGIERLPNACRFHPPSGRNRSNEPSCEGVADVIPVDIRVFVVRQLQQGPKFACSLVIRRGRDHLNLFHCRERFAHIRESSESVARTGEEMGKAVKSRPMSQTRRKGAAVEIEVRLPHHALAFSEKVLKSLKGGPLAFIEKKMLWRSILPRIRKCAE